MATDKSFAQMLTEAADYLERPDVLLYKASGVIDDDGNLVRYDGGPDPLCACAVTALMRTVSEYEYKGALEILADAIDVRRDSVMDWNDKPERRKADVVRAFRTAAARAEALS